MIDTDSMLDAASTFDNGSAFTTGSTSATQHAAVASYTPFPSWQSSGGPQLRPGRRIYAVGDVHGRFDLVSSLVLRIRADLGRFPVAAAN